MHWFVNEHDMTNDGCPVAQPRLSRRPSARMMTPCPSGNTKRSHCGLIVMRLMPGYDSRPAMSISLSKWPMFPTMALFFIFFMESTMMMSLLPVVVTKMSHHSTTSSMGHTVYPSMHACRAQMGSISEMNTRAPAAFIAAAEPLPTSPNPPIQADFPAIITSVARMMPSGSEWRQPYTLSNFDFVTESLTLMAGKRRMPSSCIS
mmetsp:Transcript_940/g.2054  ORF Transcript_940/g.2054 Transcript_940/m.2054 type:complete len:204 (-) Transcript_940:692-1303(-)